VPSVIWETVSKEGEPNGDALEAGDGDPATLLIAAKQPTQRRIPTLVNAEKVAPGGRGTRHTVTAEAAPDVEADPEVEVSGPAWRQQKQQL